MNPSVVAPVVSRSCSLSLTGRSGHGFAYRLSLYGICACWSTRLSRRFFEAEHGAGGAEDVQLSVGVLAEGHQRAARH